MAEKITSTGVVWYHCLDSCQHTSSLIHRCFCTINTNVNTAKLYWVLKCTIYSNQASSSSPLAADPNYLMANERMNLMNMAKLSIKGLIESALNLGRTLDSDYAPLQQFFVVMEHCLKHGLKGRPLPHCKCVSSCFLTIYAQEEKHSLQSQRIRG